VLAYIPWIPSYLVQQGHRGDEARRIATLASPSVEYFARANAQVTFGQPFATPRDVPGRAAVVLAVLVLAVGAAHALESGHRRSPYRDAAHVVDAWARPGDPVIQRYLLALEGSLATGLKVNFARPHPLHFAGGASEAAAWERGRRTGRVYMAVPLPGVFKRVRHAEPLAGPEREFERCRERRYEGPEDILVAEYALRDGAPGS
jgi:hypothetical protein